MKFLAFTSVLLMTTLACKTRQQDSETASNRDNSSSSEYVYLAYHFDGSKWSTPGATFLDWTSLKIYPTGDRQARMVVTKMQNGNANGAEVLQNVRNVTHLELTEADGRKNRIPLKLIKDRLKLFNDAGALTLGTVTLQGTIYDDRSIVPGSTRVGFFRVTFSPSNLDKIDINFSAPDSDRYQEGHGFTSTAEESFSHFRMKK